MSAYASANNFTENGTFNAGAVFAVESLKSLQAHDKAKQLLDMVFF